MPTPTPTLGPTGSHTSPPQTPPATAAGAGRTGTPGAAQVQLPGAAGGREEGRRLEQQTEAIVEVLAWLAAHPSAATPTATAGTVMNADTGIRPGRSGDALSATPTPDRPDRPGRPPSPDDRTRPSRPYPPAVRA